MKNKDFMSGYTFGEYDSDGIRNIYNRNGILIAMVTKPQYVGKLNSNRIDFSAIARGLQNPCREIKLPNIDQGTIAIFPDFYGTDPKVNVQQSFNGMNCSKCNTFNEYVSEPNVGNDYVCYNCR